MRNHGLVALLLTFSLLPASLGEVVTSTAAASCAFDVTVDYPEGRGLPDVSCDASTCDEGSMNVGKLYKKFAGLTELGMMVEISYTSSGGVGCQLVPDVTATVLSDAHAACNPATTTTSTTTTTTTTPELTTTTTTPEPTITTTTTTPEPTTTTTTTTPEPTTPTTTPEPTTTTTTTTPEPTTTTTTTTPEPTITTTSTTTTTTTTELPPQPTCPSGAWKMNLDLGYCYEFNKDTKTWDDAEAACSKKGSHLASIHSWQERWFIQQNLGSNSWFGLNDQSKSDTYVYSDGTSYDYSQWAYKEPSNSRRGWLFWAYEYENCIEIHTSGYWNDAFCDEKKTWVYQEPSNSLRWWWDWEYENCIEIHTSGYWNDAFCDEKKTYVCKTAIVYK